MAITEFTFNAYGITLEVPQASTFTSGPQGDSAYVVALQQGFVGSESEWLLSLQGADGAQGEPGTPGTAFQLKVNGTNVSTPTALESIDFVGGITSSEAAGNATITIPYSGLYKGKWNMSSGTQGNAAPFVADGGTFNSGSFTPASPTIGSSGAYFSLLESKGTIALEDTVTRSASVVSIPYNIDNTVLLTGLALVNSGATAQDIYDVLSTGGTSNPVWMAGFQISQSDQTATIFEFNNSSSVGVDSFTSTAEEKVFLDFDYTTNEVTMRDSVNTSLPATLNVQDIPEDQYLKLVVFSLNVGQSVVLTYGTIPLNFSETTGGRNGFLEPIDATLPAGAVDQDEYYVSASGYYGGRYAKTGQLVKLVNSAANILVIPKATALDPITTINGKTGKSVSLTYSDVGAEQAGAAAALHAIKYDAQSLTAAQIIQAQTNIGTQVFTGTAFPTGAATGAVLFNFDSNSLLDIKFRETATTLWNSGGSNTNGTLDDATRTAVFSSTGSHFFQNAITKSKSSGKVNCTIKVTSGPSTSDSLLGLYWLNNNGEYCGAFFRLNSSNATTGGGGLSDYFVKLDGSNNGTTGGLIGNIIDKPIRLLMDIDTGSWELDTSTYHAVGTTTATPGVAGKFMIGLYHYPSEDIKLDATVEILATDYLTYTSI